jgi:hypothetical protein
MAAALLAQAPAAAPQTVQYAYDRAGRVSVVADTRGDLAVYEYDAVGNVLSIRRIAVGDAPGPVVIAVVVPAAGRPGDTVSIFGRGFAATASANTVSFGGAVADVLTAAPTRLTVTVPPDAATGPLRVVAPSGAATSPEPFRVPGALGVDPATAVVAPGGSVQFSASGDGVTAVRWSVEGRDGGDAVHGTIAPDGRYVAPAAAPPRDVRVTATSVDDPAVEGTARVSVVAARSLFVVAPAVGAAGAVTPMAFVAAAPLTVRVAPVLTRVSPPEGLRGDRVRVTVSGAGLDGATGLEFLVGTAADPALTVTELAVGPDGREATAAVTIAATADPGPRVVRIVTPAGTSGAAALGDNVFTVR